MNVKNINRKQITIITIITTVIGFVIGQIWKSVLLKEAQIRAKTNADLEALRLMRDPNISPEEFERLLDELDKA